VLYNRRVAYFLIITGCLGFAITGETPGVLEA